MTKNIKKEFTPLERKRAISWLVGAHFTHDLYSGFLDPIMPFIAAKLGMSMFFAITLVSITHICSSFIQPLLGFISDIHKKRFFIFWGMILGTVAIPLAAAATNIRALITYVILGSLGGAFFHPQALGYLPKFSKDDFLKNMGYFVGAGTLGYAISPVVSSLYADRFGFAKMPYLIWIGIFVSLLMFVCVPKAFGTVLEKPSFNFKETVNNIFSNKAILALMGIMFSKLSVTHISAILLPYLWRDLGFGLTYVGVALFLFMIASATGSFISRHLEKRIGLKPVFFFSMSFALPLLLIFLFSYAEHPYIALLCFVAMGFTNSLAQPVIIAVAQKIMPDYKGLTGSIMNGFIWGLVMLLLLVATHFAEIFGIVKALFFISLLPLLATTLIKYVPQDK